MNPVEYGKYFFFKILGFSSSISHVKWIVFNFLIFNSIVTPFHLENAIGLIYSRKGDLIGLKMWLFGRVLIGPKEVCLACLFIVRGFVDYL